MKSERLLLLTAFIISGCSLCYELIIGAISSYISGDTVWQYSVTIGLYMAAMGFGSYISKYIRRNLYDWFIGIEVIIGIIGGLSATFIFLANLYLEAYQVVMYAFIIGIGILVGMEIPLLARILEVERGDLRHTLSSVFAFDYMGGLAGSVVFPLLFLPHLG
ncbi:MAG: spermidine synthase, partial [Megasphaera micronuciformis]|nr:spermidine synthase [Megasphaera micronuciformis]